MRKLEPLTPRQVARWRAVLDFGDPDVRSLVEREVRHAAHRLLGPSFQERILLSLPSKSTAHATFNLGTVVYDTAKWPVGISPVELTQHLAIFGRSGAGKTNVTFHLLDQLIRRRVPVLFLDWKRTARHLIPLFGKRLQVYTPGRDLAPFPFNPFLVPPGCEAHTYVNHLVDLLADAYTLGEGAKSILHRALELCYQRTDVPSLSDVRQAVADMETKERQSGWKISATRALESVAFSKTTNLDSTAQRAFAKALLRQHTIVELDGLSQSSKKFLIPLLCFWLYSVQLARRTREQLQFVIVLEEAHNTLYGAHRTKESLMNMLLRQGRELGIGFVVVDQHPHLISSVSLGNCYTTIFLNLKDPSDIHKAAGVSQLDDNEKRYFSLLPVGQGIVKLQDRWRKPFLVQFPQVPVRKGEVTDEVLGDLQAGKINLAAIRERGHGGSVENQRSRLGDDSLATEAVRLLHDVVKHPDDGVDRRYKRLGVSAAVGHRWKEQLIDNGLLQPQRTKVGRTHRVLLRITDQARQILPAGDASDSRASVVHEYWKYWHARRLSRAGYRVELEAPRPQGRMDVLATHDLERIGLEVETGKSDVVRNVQQDLLAGCTRVIVVVTDEQTLPKVERRLAEAGLLLPQRVTVVLQDQIS